ncbi:LAETG motif-containing sortase-dependent surface protein [Streptomyces albidoflavus]
MAATGGSSATPVIGGIAVALVVIGGATVFLLRRKKISAES